MLTDLLLLGVFDASGYETPITRTITIPLKHCGLQIPEKFADELLDYKLDWTARLAGDRITAVRIGVASGSIEVTRIVFDAASVSFWVGGGTSGLGSEVMCLVTTSGGRRLEEMLSAYCI